MDGKLFYSISEARALLKVSPATMARWIREKKIHSVKVGGRRYVPIAVLDALAVVPAQGTDGGKRV